MGFKMNYGFQIIICNYFIQEFFNLFYWIYCHDYFRFLKVFLLEIFHYVPIFLSPASNIVCYNQVKVIIIFNFICFYIISNLLTISFYYYFIFFSLTFSIEFDFTFRIFFQKSIFCFFKYVCAHWIWVINFKSAFIFEICVI